MKTITNKTKNSARIRLNIYKGMLAYIKKDKEYSKGFCMASCKNGAYKFKYEDESKWSLFCYNDHKRDSDAPKCALKELLKYKPKNENYFNWFPGLSQKKGRKKRIKILKEIIADMELKAFNKQHYGLSKGKTFRYIGLK